MVTLRPIVKAQHFDNVLKTAFTLIHNLIWWTIKNKLEVNVI